MGDRPIKGEKSLEHQKGQDEECLFFDLLNAAHRWALLFI